jgi:hypothetical protein
MSMSRNNGDGEGEIENERNGDFFAGFISGLCVFGIASLIFLIFLWII